MIALDRVSHRYTDGTSGLADVSIDPDVAGREPSAVNRCWDNFHDMGTARMSADPTNGVVDREQARHVRGLARVDGPCMAFGDEGDYGARVGGRLRARAGDDPL